MKSKIAIALLAATTLVGFGSSAFAYGGGNINARQDRQNYRIERGIDNGELTRREIRRLRKEQADIAWLEECLRKFGRRGLDYRERRILVRLLDVASRNIRDLKQNNQRSNRRNRRHSGYNDDNHQTGDTNGRRGRFSWLRRR